MPKRLNLSPDAALEHKRESNRRRQAAYRSKPESRLKLIARLALRLAVDAGRIVRPTACPFCGAHGPTEAHHVDYSRPLHVYWACRQCHRGILDRSNEARILFRLLLLNSTSRRIAA